MTVRHDLVTSKGSQQGGPTLRDHSATLYASIKSGLESALTNLKVSHTHCIESSSCLAVHDSLYTCCTLYYLAGLCIK